MKFYVTKHCLTKGILVYEEKRGEVEVSITQPPILWVSYYQGFRVGEWFTSEEDAIKDACKRRDLKLASLKKQMQKLKQLTFNKKEI